MAIAKSPFLVLREFMSPKICEQLVDSLGFYTPDFDREGNPIKMYRYKESAEEIVYNHLQPVVPQIMDYYVTDYKGTETIQFEYFNVGITPEPICENSDYLRRKWVRTKDRDLTGILFQSDYNDQPPFDTDYECFGGKLEFPQHSFSFHPERGTMIVYPSDPHFINATSMVLEGELVQARIHMAAKLPYLYDPTEFPGDYTVWFKDLI